MLPDVKLAFEIVDGYFACDELSTITDAWEILKAAVLAQQTNNNARDEICPFYKTNDMAHVGDGLGIPECTCKGKLGKLSPVA